MGGVKKARKSNFAFFVQTLLRLADPVDKSVDTCLILSGILATLSSMFQLCSRVPKVVPSLIFGWNRFLLCRSSSYAVCSNVPVFPNRTLS